MKKKQPMNTGWYNKYEKNVTLDKFTFENGFSTKRYSTYYKKIDYNITEGSSLCFRSVSSDIRLYIDGKLVLDTPYKESPLSVRSSGSVWYFYKFNSSDIGKTLTFKVRPFYNDNTCYITDMYVCDAGHYIYDIFADNSIFLILCILLIIIGITFIVASLFIGITQKISSGSLMYIGFFALVLGTWASTSTHLLELIFNNSQAIQTLACICLYLFVIPAMLFVDNVLDLSPKRYVYLCQAVNIVSIFTVTVLHLTGVADFHESLTVSHLNLAYSLVTIITLCLVKKSKKPTENITTISLGNSKTSRTLRSILFISTAVCVFIDIAQFIKGTTAPGFYSSCNIVLIIVYLACLSITNLFDLSNSTQHANFVKQLAYKDGLTDVGNRTAYKEKIKFLDDHIDSYKAIGVVIFDVNDLKITNDTYGHLVGDELIIDVSNLIKQSFTDFCTLYRIGGDEFAVIIEAPNSEAIYKVSIMQFNVNVHNHNAFYNKDYKVSVAHGSAFYKNNKNMTLREIISTADKNMYENKKSLKNKQ